MEPKIEDFLSVGLSRYKQASATLVAFGQEVESRLKGILSDRPADRWGRFVPEPVKSTKSTKYWSQYPALNAKIVGAIEGVTVTITIDMNWYLSEREYPFFSAWFDPAEPYASVLGDFDWNDAVAPYESGIRLVPDENDFALERDFGVILDEVERFLKSDLLG
jgi:hypothetical protein